MAETSAKKNAVTLKINAPLFIFCLALYFVCVINVPFWVQTIKILAALNFVGFGFAFSIPILILCVFNIFFTCFSINHVEKIFYILIIITAAIISYAMYNYGVLFDTSMIVNILQSNYHEINTYVNLSACGWVLCFGILPSYLIYKLEITHRNTAQEIKNKTLSILISACLIMLISSLYYKDYAAIKRNNTEINKMLIPLHFIYSSGKYINNNFLTAKPAYKHIGLDAKNIFPSQGDKNHLLVFVVGETARSMNYQLNGYPRATNQHTENLDLISFKNVLSCGTNTAVSIPCMFAKIARDDYSLPAAASQDNLLDILQHAGLNVLWIDNNAGCYQTCKKIPSINIPTAKNKWCDGHYCVDEVLLADLQNQIDIRKGKNTVIVLHAIGSHGPTYYQRFPSEHRHFQPNCLRSDIQNCSQEELLNTYDNSILYTDFVLHKLIELLKTNNQHWHTAMLYVSDHGESLGEKGLYLHGFPYNLAPMEQKHVPYLAWFAESFIQSKQLDINCLKKLADSGYYSHDNIFSSVLGIMDIETTEYQPNQDMFFQCRQRLDLSP